MLRVDRRAFESWVRVANLVDGDGMGSRFSVRRLARPALLREWIEKAASGEDPPRRSPERDLVVGQEVASATEQIIVGDGQIEHASG